MGSSAYGGGNVVQGVTGSNGIASSGGITPNLSLTGRNVITRITDYTLQPSDVGTLQIMSSPTMQYLIFPAVLPVGWWCDCLSIQSQLNLAGGAGTNSINGQGGGGNIPTIPFRVIRIFCVSAGNFITSEACNAPAGALIIQGSAVQGGLAPAGPGGLVGVGDTGNWQNQFGQVQAVLGSGGTYNLAATHNRKMLFFSGTLNLTQQTAGFTCDVRNTGSTASPVYPPSGYVLNGQGANVPYYLSPNQCVRLATYDGSNYWIANQNWPESVNGSVTLGSSTNLPQNTYGNLVSMVLPCAGTYLITGSICGYAVSTTGLNVYGAVQDSTSGTYVVGGLPACYTTSYAMGVYGFSAVWTVTTSHQLNMQAMFTGSGSVAQAVGGSFMQYLRLY